MNRMHEKCIFCYAQLPPPDLRKGEGEHVIPKNILGNWQSGDACEACKQHFGDKIDPLPLSNFDIIDAVCTLDLPNKEAFTESVKYIGKDEHTGEERRMFKKKGKFIVNVTESDTVINLPNENILNVGLPKVKKNYRNRFDEKLIEQELLKLHKKYQTLDVDKKIGSDKVPVTFRRGNLSQIKPDRSSHKYLSPLIAKIAVFFLNYLYTYEGLKIITNYQDLVNHARYDKPIPDGMIEFAPFMKDKEYYQAHRVAIMPWGSTVKILNISLLGYPNWRVWLYYDKEIVLQDDDGNELDLWGFEFDYENDSQLHFHRIKGEEKNKYFAGRF